MNQSALKLFVLLWSMSLALMSQAAPVVRYIHTDTLGSPVASTDEHGNLLWQERYQPFGTRVSTPERASYRDKWFTGHTQSRPDGLVHMGARFYEPTSGRFISPDPAGINPTDPRTVNRYVYANNNPFAYVDPDGRNAVALFGGVLVESWNFVSGQETHFDNLLGAAIDGYDGEGQGFAAAALEDALSFIPAGAIVGTASKIAKFAQSAKGAGASKNLSKAPDGTLFGLCFAEGTEIHAKDGLKRIEEIKVGDLVAAKDEATGETSWQPVVRLFKNEHKQVVRVTLADREGNNDTITATLEHPFWVNGAGWVEASKLSIEDQVTNRSGEHLIVVDVVPGGTEQFTYNFEVKLAHTYFVGKLGAWVHNASSIYPTTADAKIAAEAMGFKKIKETVHDGQAVFQRSKKEFITRDVDNHSGKGAWKMATSVKNLGSKSTRDGTFDKNLKRIGD